MKVFKWIYENILFLITLFLLVFIPLYPKLPILDIKNTWVYIRVEDFIVAFVLLFWIILLLAKKITLKTPLTMPIILFWIVGAISTIHGILLIFPTMANVFPNLAFLNYLRRIEYVGLFFIAYSGLKDKRFISYITPYIVAVLAVTLLLIVGYGFGQKFYGFPAYLTMNEEFAKGIPIRLSQLSRVSSTFGGHYDLAAYLVLMIPLLGSMIFAFRNWFVKAFLFTTVSLGFGLLFMTVSRSSFFVLMFSMILMLFLHKKRLAIFAVIFLFLAGIVFLSFSSSLLERFGSTVKKVDVIVDAKTGEVVGNVKEIPSENFKDKTIKIRYASNKNEVYAIMQGKREDSDTATNSALIIPYSYLPDNIPLIIESRVSTGETLPEGTGYINLTLTPIKKKIGQFFYPRSDNKEAKEFNEVLAIQGNFIIKRVSAYDLSFTTRFQGEWPNTINIFKKNIIFGSGYSSTGLAVDNNYLRILGEVGLLGFVSYFGIFFTLGIYIKKVLPEVDSLPVKSFVFGFIAGMFGLALNAMFIDVFEASKIAFLIWLLVGVVVGLLHFYQKKDINLSEEVKKALTSTYAVIIYLFIIVTVGFGSFINYYFVGDDFTWFRWVADCKGCTILNYFTEAGGFFYRPGTKIYFLLMYSGFWLNQAVYHSVSIFLHFIAAMLLFLIAHKILKNFLLSIGASFLFIILSGYSETVFWISSTGFLFNAVFILLGLLFFILFEEKKKNIYLIFSIVSIVFSMLFHELGVIAPFLIILYRVVFGEKFNFKQLFEKIHYKILFLPIFPYLILRYLAGSHWFSGDYSYSLFKLPQNIIGNIIGYLLLALFGPLSLTLYQQLRNFSKEHLILVSLISIAVVFINILAYKIIFKKMVKEDRKIIVFGFLFFVISLLPFLGLGNIASRYSYLSSIGFIILFVFFLKKLYNYLLFNGKNIALAIFMVVIGIFGLIHIIQLQKIHTDWDEAGEKSKRFLTSLNEVYENNWTKESMDLYFVNVPIRHGDAWVFPVGLKDAVWFVSRNRNINVHQIQSLDVLNTANILDNSRIFEFNSDGSFIEKKILRNTSIIPAAK